MVISVVLTLLGAQAAWNGASASCRYVEQAVTERSVPDQIVQERLEEFRRAVVSCNLDFDSVLKSTLDRPDESRLKKLPDSDMWPRILGNVPPRAATFQRMQKPGDYTLADALILGEPFKSKAVIERSLTWIIDGGIEPSGIIVCKSYDNILCFGRMSGNLRFESYGNAFVKGDVSGQLSSASYFCAYITGDVSGGIFVTSSCSVYVMGKLAGEFESTKQRSKLYIGGRTNRADLVRIKGPATVTLADSDLPSGDHQIGELKVRVLPKP